MKTKTLPNPFTLTLITVITLSAEVAPVALAQPMNQPPLVIAHRGSSGYLPEHTLAAYAMAHGQGADFIEQDLVLTKDRQLICLHDLNLEATTDVASRYLRRRRPDGHWYAIDFTLEEVRSLRVHERLPARFPQRINTFQIPTFGEAIDLILGLNQSTGRQAGLYPELKGPSFHRESGAPIEEVFVGALREKGLEHATDLVFVQCFERATLERLRKAGLDLPLIYLLGNNEQARQAISGNGLQQLKSIVQGIGPSKHLLHAYPDLVKRCHQAGLLVHPYTFRQDEAFPNPIARHFEGELQRYLIELKVDGVFTDFPDRVRAFLEATPHGESGDATIPRHPPE